MKFLNYQFWKMKRSLSPSSAFKKELLQHLGKSFENVALPVVFWYQTTFWRYSVAGFLGVVIMGSTGVYAYASPNVSEGTVLYPLKEQIENIEEKLQTTPEKKAKFYLKKVERREAELKVLSAKKTANYNTIKKIEETKTKLQNIKVELKGKKLKDKNLPEKMNRQLEDVPEFKLPRTEKRVQKFDREMPVQNSTTTKSFNIKLRHEFNIEKRSH